MGGRKGRIESLSVEASGFVENLARMGLGGEESEGPSLVQASPRYPDLEEALNDDALARRFPGSARPDRLALAAGLFQVLDYWEASHNAAQEADDLGEQSTSTYWHMIAHRREPDADNALYWARRVGRHPIFEELAATARPLLEAHGDPSPASPTPGDDPSR
jgi:hypothetical protein